MPGLRGNKLKQFSSGIRDRQYSSNNERCIIYYKSWGEGNSVVFHQSFLTHSACQYDVT